MTTPYARPAAALVALLSICLAGCSAPEDPARLWKAVNAQAVSSVQAVATSASAPAY